MAPKTKEAILALNARELIEEIEKTSDVTLLDDIELGEMQREDEKKGSGRTTVFAALKARRAELADPGPENPKTLSELARTLDPPIPGAGDPQKRPAPPARTSGSVRVRAKSKGFYGGNRIRAGALFTIESEKQLAPWMELVGDEPEEEVAAAPAADDSSSGSNGSDVI